MFRVRGKKEIKRLKKENLKEAIRRCTEAKVLLNELKEDNDYTNAAIERLESAQESIMTRLNAEL